MWIRQQDSYALFCIKQAKQSIKCRKIAEDHT